MEISIHLPISKYLHSSFAHEKNRIITNRFALAQGADKTKCDLGQQTWCRGIWNT